LGKVVLNKVEKRYGTTLACTEIELAIEAGEFFTFLGPSGCGKTTILRMIGGFIRPDKGTIHVGGADITHLEPEKRGVGMVFQNYALFPFMSVAENVEYGLRMHRWDRQRIRHKRDQMLATVGLHGYGQRKIAELSGGEQQRVALARSLAVEPKVLLLDEPLSNLDARLRDSMRSELKRMQRDLGITTIFVTHDQAEAMTLSDRIAVFDNGRCIQTGRPEEVYENPANAFVARFVGETNLFPVRCQDGGYVLPGGLRVDGLLPPNGRFLSIRPHHLRLSATVPDQPIRCLGTIDEVVYHGLLTEYRVRAQGIEFQVSQVNTGPQRRRFAVEDRVWVSFSCHDARVLAH
jgi:iron(III) transport system ATP-binding protein